jgi:hypothetical protein
MTGIFFKLGLFFFGTFECLSEGLNHLWDELGLAAHDYARNGFLRIVAALDDSHVHEAVIPLAAAEKNACTTIFGIHSWFSLFNVGVSLWDSHELVLLAVSINGNSADHIWV